MGNVAGAALGAAGTLGGGGGGGSQSQSQSQQESSQQSTSRPSTYAPSDQGYAAQIPVYQAYGQQANAELQNANDFNQAQLQPLIQSSYGAMDSLMDSMGIARPAVGSYANAMATYGQGLKSTAQTVDQSTLSNDLGGAFSYYANPTTGLFANITPGEQSPDLAPVGSGTPGTLIGMPQWAPTAATPTNPSASNATNGASTLAGQYNAANAQGAYSTSPPVYTPPGVQPPYAGTAVAPPSQQYNYVNGVMQPASGINSGLGNGNVLSQPDWGPGAQAGIMDAQRTVNAYNGLANSSTLSDKSFSSALSDLTSDQNQVGTDAKGNYTAAITDTQNLQNFASSQGESIQNMATVNNKQTNAANQSANVQAMLASDPNYQFQMQQGLKAINAQAAASGYNLSPAAAQQLSTFAQGQASSAMSSYRNQLSSIMSQGLQGLGMSQSSTTNMGNQQAGVTQNVGQGVAASTANATSGWQVGPVTQQSTSQSTGSSSSSSGPSTASTIGGIASAAGSFLGAL